MVSIACCRRAILFRMELKAVRAIADDNIGTLFRWLLWDRCRWVDRVAAVFELQTSSIDLFFDIDYVVGGGTLALSSVDDGTSNHCLCNIPSRPRSVSLVFLAFASQLTS